MLMAVGTAASLISIDLLLWAFVGAILGAGLGLYGMNTGFMEILAAIAMVGFYYTKIQIYLALVNYSPIQWAHLEKSRNLYE